MWKDSLNFRWLIHLKTVQPCTKKFGEKITKSLEIFYNLKRKEDDNNSTVFYFFFIVHCICFSFGPMSIFYATLGFCILHCIIFLLMWLMARSTNPELNLPSSSRPKSSELKKKNLETIQETQESSCSVLDYRSLNYSVHNLPSSSEVSSTCDYSESDYPSYDYRPPILALEEIKPPPHIHN